MDDYTVDLSDVANSEGRLRVKHGTQVRMTLHDGDTVLRDELTDIESMDACLTVWGVMYNSAAMSGGVCWTDPGTGRPLNRPQVRRRLRAADVLADGQLCDCAKCLAEPAHV